MAEGPRCKRRKQANPRRKNGKTARTQSPATTPANSGLLCCGVPARAPRGGRTVCPQDATKSFITGLRGVCNERRVTVGSGRDGAGPGPAGTQSRSEADSRKTVISEPRSGCKPVDPRRWPSVKGLDGLRVRVRFFILFCKCVRGACIKQPLEVFNIF